MLQLKSKNLNQQDHKAETKPQLRITPPVLETKLSVRLKKRDIVLR